ncbi:MAG TPA: protein kinase [Gemmatimonadales bacterium]|nr:protein kinase [Gemmatimonadales bacterium]
MPLTAGDRLGPYEIVAPLGAGGMGEVYRARDSRLGRDVAIKALPAEFAQDPERLARFEREARLLASLSHPNIAGIHGLEEVAGHRHLVLEFVEGESLAERLARGPLPPEEAIEVCRQVAAGVEAAHENGVIHRDLKPGNIMLTPSGAVKVLDFGLAKGGATSASNPNLSASPTMTHATGAGMLLGTAAYMSPEQARGKAVDRRTDVWSFGCVLYECLAGRQAFEGETVSDLIARILEREPDWSAIPAATPPRVVELLRRCLTKDATLRLRDIGEARIALAAPAADARTAATHAAAVGRPARAWFVPAIVAVLAVIATAAVLLAIRPSHPAGPVRRFRVPVPGLSQHFWAPLALTRDGRTLAYEANDRIWIRRLDQSDAVEVPGSKRGRSPFWSWDQGTLCFAADKKLWAFTPGAEQPREICDIPESGEIVGGAWSADGRIVMAVWRSGLYEVPSAGGDVRVSLPIDSSIVDFHGPSFLPDGRTLLLLVHDKGDRAVAVVEGNPPRLKRVYEASRWNEVSYSRTGHLLGTAVEGMGPGSEIWAVPFSASSRRVTGPAFRVLDGARLANTSSDGLLVAYAEPPSPLGQLIWRRRDGAEETIGEPQTGLSGPSLSPDGRRVAYATEQDGNSDIWVQDLARGTRTRITSSPIDEVQPSWSPDGSRLFYTATQGVGHIDIVAIGSDGGGTPDTLAHGYQPVVSPDGRNLAYMVDNKGNGDLWVLPLNGGGAAKPILATPAAETSPSFSPDGRWLAYVSDESGSEQVYIRRFPEGDLRAQVSVKGGSWPRWTRRGDGIYYAKGDTLMLVAVGTGPRPTLGLPHLMLVIPAHMPGAPADADPDGVRFIAARQAAPPEPPSLLFVENWFEEFRKR